MERRCDQCEWWGWLEGYVGEGKEGRKEVGECHRYPSENGYGLLVITGDSDWCGEFTPKGGPFPLHVELRAEIESLKIRLTKLEITRSQEEFGKKGSDDPFDPRKTVKPMRIVKKKQGSDEHH